MGASFVMLIISDQYGSLYTLHSNQAKSSMKTSIAFYQRKKTHQNEDSAQIN